MTGFLLKFRLPIPVVILSRLLDYAGCVVSKLSLALCDHSVLFIIQAQNEQKLRWQKYIQEKRKSESVQNLLRMEEIKQSLRASQILLEDSIRKRDERVQQLKQEQDERKVGGCLLW